MTSTTWNVGRRLVAEAAIGDADADCGDWLALFDATDPETASIDDVLALADSAPTPYWAGFLSGQCAIRLRRGRG